jgi:hypothetical protein
MLPRSTGMYTASSYLITGDIRMRSGQEWKRL